MVTICRAEDSAGHEQIDAINSRGCLLERRGGASRVLPCDVALAAAPPSTATVKFRDTTFGKLTQRVLHLRNSLPHSIEYYPAQYTMVVGSVLVTGCVPNAYPKPLA